MSLLCIIAQFVIKAKGQGYIRDITMTKKTLMEKNKRIIISQGRAKKTARHSVKINLSLSHSMVYGMYTAELILIVDARCII